MSQENSSESVTAFDLSVTAFDFYERFPPFRVISPNPTVMSNCDPQYPDWSEIVFAQSCANWKVCPSQKAMSSHSSIGQEQLNKRIAEDFPRTG